MFFKTYFTESKLLYFTQSIIGVKFEVSIKSPISKCCVSFIKSLIIDFEKENANKLFSLSLKK